MFNTVSKQLVVLRSSARDNLQNSNLRSNPCFWCATRQVDKLNNENFFFPGTVYVPGYLCNVF